MIYVRLSYLSSQHIMLTLKTANVVYVVIATQDQRYPLQDGSSQKKLIQSVLTLFLAINHISFSCMIVRLIETLPFCRGH